MIRRLIRRARRRRDLRIAKLSDTKGYLPFPASAERLYNGDQPHCPDCVIDWDSEADRCGLIPCAGHCLNCRDQRPCIRHQPQGRHHAPARHQPPHPYVKWSHCDGCYATFETFGNTPRYGPEPVIGQCEWADEMERRVAQ